jgi:hypothetical protein
MPSFSIHPVVYWKLDEDGEAVAVACMGNPYREPRSEGLCQFQPAACRRQERARFDGTTEYVGVPNSWRSRLREI